MRKYFGACHRKRGELRRILMIDIEHLKKYYKKEQMIISRHALQQSNKRGISLAEIRECIMNGEIIEQYPDDFPFPSCLVYGKSASERVLHVVVSEETVNGRIITAYVPNTTIFKSDLKTRREKDEM